MKQAFVCPFYSLRIVSATMFFGSALPLIATEGGLEAVFREPCDVRLLLRTVQSELLPASGAFTQDVGSVFFEPADGASSRWLQRLRSSSPPEGFPVLVFEDAETFDVVATNLESGASAVVDPDPDESPLWALEPLESFDPDVRDRLAPYFDPSLVSVRFVLVSPGVAPLPEPGPDDLASIDDMDSVRPTDERAVDAPDDVRGSFQGSVRASRPASTNAPTRVAVPVVRRLVFSPAGDDVRLSFRTALQDASSVVVRGTASAAGLDIRGRTGVVRIGSGSVLSVRSASDERLQTSVLLPSDAAVAPSSAPTGTVSSVFSARQDCAP